jgi:hypothetical protein
MLRTAPLSGRLAVALFALGLACSLAGCGITAPRSNDGFADLEPLAMRDTERVLKLSIGPTLLRFAARHVEDDPQVRSLLHELDGVRIEVYEIDGDPRRVAESIDQMSRHLQSDGWEVAMLAREQDETVHMLLRWVDGRISGMTVLVSDGVSEAVVVNLMGEIAPRHFGDVMVALDLESHGLDGVDAAPGG